MPFSRLALASVSLLALALGSPAAAQGGRPAEGNGKAIRDRLGTLLADGGQLERLNGNLERICTGANGADACEATPVGRKFKDMLAKAERTRERAKGAHARTYDDDFQELTRRRPKKADPTAAAVALGNAEPVYDEESGKDLIEDLNEIESDVEDLNDILESRPPPVVANAAIYHFPADWCLHPHIRLTALVAAKGARVVSDAKSAACNQTVVVAGNGGNAALVCGLVFYTAAVLDAAIDSLNFICDENSGAESEATYLNTLNLINGLNSSNDAIFGVLDALGKTQEQILRNQAVILELLRTPQGQRPGFPAR